MTAAIPLIAIPGWAMDEAIFSGVQLPGMVTILSSDTMHFEERLLTRIAYLQAPKIDLLGFSMGGFLAQAFALKHPEKINRLFLAGIRSHYPDTAIIKRYLTKNKALYLEKFYTACLPSPPDATLNGLFSRYIIDWPIDTLLQSLAYLAQARIQGDVKPPFETVLFHGKQDVIAPLSEAQTIAETLGSALHIFEEAGHLVVVDPDFCGTLARYRSNP